MIVEQLFVNNNTAVSVFKASNMFERMRGLLGRTALNAREAFWLSPCNAIHTAFMKYPIDVVFMSGTGEVKKIVLCVMPWSMTCCWKAHSVLEMCAGATLDLGIQVGSQLHFENLSTSTEKSLK
mgnify:CR=1 FL=1